MMRALAWLVVLALLVAAAGFTVSATPWPSALLLMAALALAGWLAGWGDIDILGR